MSIHDLNSGCKDCIHREEIDKSPECIKCFGSVDKSYYESKVNHPSHYQGTFECIDEMKALFPREWVKGFCACNAYKYKYRAGKKAGNSYDEDIKKADWYMRELMKMQEEDKDSRKIQSL